MKDEPLLSAKEASRDLGLPLVKRQRWVYQGTLPCRYKDGAHFFKKDKLHKWADEHDITVSEGLLHPESSGRVPKINWELKLAVQRGGIHFDLAGDDIVSTFKNAVPLMPFPQKYRQKILEELLDREEIASTGIGKGIAIPHPRKVLDLGLTKPVVPAFFLHRPIDFNAVDRKPVSVLFFIFTPSTRIHLELLARLSFCMRSSDFLEALEHPEENKILELIGRMEAELHKD